MTLPSFLLIGAAKSGTTSLYSYLAQHPAIFMSTPKEPNFFALEDQAVAFAGPGDSIVNAASITRLHDYEALFQAAPPTSERGEASTLYLYNAHAPACIQRHVASARLIVLLRNPVDRAYSSYLHMVRDGREPLPTFEAALAAEETRIAANWEHLWHYRHLGFYARQLQRYFQLFRRTQITVYTYDQFLTTPLSVLSQIFQFLQVRSDFQPDMSVRHEVSGMPLVGFLNRLMRQPGPVKVLAKRVLSQSTRSRVYAAVMKYNIRAQRPALLPETRRMLVDAYRDDIMQLEAMIGQDLSAWYRTEN